MIALAASVAAIGAQLREHGATRYGVELLRAQLLFRIASDVRRLGPHAVDPGTLTRLVAVETYLSTLPQEGADT